MTTDFGLQDHYVASMKGILLGVNPATQIVDITHELPAFSIESGAYAISQAAPCFPAGTVHLVVVDPGVGTERRPMLLEASGQVFVAPDNGVLTLVASRDPNARAFEIMRRDLMRQEVSATFHGRDVFAPVAAAIAAGKASPSEVGPAISDLKIVSDLEPQETSTQSWRSRILSVDRFGNLITGFPSARFPFVSDSEFELKIGQHVANEVRTTFGHAQTGSVFVYFGSSGYLEIGVNKGSAAAVLGAEIGQVVTLIRT